jgi:hypothetical protein
MAGCNVLVRPIGLDKRDRHNRPSCLYSGGEAALDMAKKYAVLRLKTPKPEGGFLEAFELGMADLNAWGDEYYDVSGYPYPDEVHAFVHDWIALGGDFQEAMRKVDQLAREHNSRITGAVDNGAKERASTSAKK